MFLFLLFGGGTRYRDQGPGHERHCARCLNTATWTRLRRYREITLFLIPVARWARHDVEACPICGAQTEIAVSPSTPNATPFVAVGSTR